MFNLRKLTKANRVSHCCAASCCGDFL